MASYHPVESRLDINNLFYNHDLETGQMSGCISLAYRAITQKSLDFFKANKSQLFGSHDIKFGIDIQPGFTYEGHQHYKGLYNLVNHLDQMTSEDRQAFVVRSVILLKCLMGSGYFSSQQQQEDQQSDELTSEQLFIGELLFHFQTGIQYNLHAVYQVKTSSLFVF